MRFIFKKHRFHLHYASWNPTQMSLMCEVYNIYKKRQCLGSGSAWVCFISVFLCIWVAIISQNQGKFRYSRNRICSKNNGTETLIRGVKALRLARCRRKKSAVLSWSMTFLEQGDQLNMAVFSGIMWKVTCTVYATVHVYTVQCTLYKALFPRYHKTRPCLTGHPVSYVWCLGECKVQHGGIWRADKESARHRRKNSSLRPQT